MFLLIQIVWVPSTINTEVNANITIERTKLQIIASAISSDIIISDLAKISYTLNEVIDGSETWKHIVLKNSSGITLFPIDIQFNTHNLIELIEPVIIDNDTIAKITSYTDYSVVKERIKNNVMHLYLLLLGVVILLFLIVNIILYFLVVKRLRPISIAASQLSQGYYPEPIENSIHDEIGSFQKEFNVMISSIKTRDLEILYQTEHLKILEQSKQLIFDTIGYAIIKTDDHGYITETNKSAAVFLKLPKDAMKTNIISFFPYEHNEWYNPKTTTPFQDIIHYLHTSSMGFRECIIQRSPGSLTPTEITYSTIESHLSEQNEHLFIIRDLTLEEESRQKKQLVQSVFDHAGEAMLITDAQARIVDVNAAYQKITGYTKQDVLGQNPNISKSGKHDKNFYYKMWQEINLTGFWSGDLWDKKKDGALFAKHLTITSIKDRHNKTVNYIGIFKDITEQKETVNKLRDLAFYDHLTHLYNRSMILQQLTDYIKLAKRYNKVFAVLFIDLDGFKNINDTEGHAVGDEVLKIVASRIKESLRDSDNTGRIGGDEFIVILNELHNFSNAQVIASKIIESLSRTITIKYKSIYINASIGISLFPENGETTEILIRNADMAMYEAKKIGKGVTRFFTHEMNKKITQKLNIENALQSAISNNEFHLCYQPKINTHHNIWCGYEALLRWDNKKLGAIPPDIFIPIAEESSIIEKLGDWVIDKACEDWSTLSQVKTISSLSINLSSRQLHNTQVVETIKRCCSRHNTPFEALEFEITETAMFKDFETALPIITDIKNLGCRLSLDDFGTGYSSLSYLDKIPISALKIDKSFVQKFDQSDQAYTMVESILSIAQKMNLDVIAEGVETENQKQKLIDLNCSTHQGFFYSKPLTLEQIEVKTEQMPH